MINFRGGKQTNFFFFFSILFWIFIFCLLLYNSFSYLDPDLGWHLRAGEHVLTSGEVPGVNYYNYTLEGKSWVDHEWLMDGWTFLLYSKAGYIGVNLFFALLAAAVLYFVYSLARRKDGSAILAMLIMILGVVSMLPHLGVRMQEITLLGLFILMFLWHRFEKTKRVRPLLWMIPLFFLWANLHAGFLLGLFLLFAYGFVKTGELWLYHRYRWDFIDFRYVLEAKVIAKYFAMTFLGAASTLLTPYGTELYAFLGGYTNSFYLTHINEWLPQYFPPFYYGQLLYLSIVVVSLALTFVYAVYVKDRKHRVNIWHFFLVLLFAFLAFKSRRHFPLLFIASFSWVVNFYSIFLGGRGNILISGLSKWLKTYLIAVVFLCSAYLLATANFTTDPFFSFCHKYPCQAVSFLKDSPHLQDKKVFNYYGWGGYLIHEYPQGRLFIDGRLPQYRLGDSTMLEEYYYFFDPDLTAKMLDEYDVEMVLFKKIRSPEKYDWFERFIFSIDEGKIEDKSRDLFVFLRDSHEWEKIFEDDVSFIFIKKQDDSF
jgi:hypothetical protein